MTTLEHKRNIEKNLLKLSTFVPLKNTIKDEIGSVVTGNNSQPIYFQVDDDSMVKFLNLQGE